MRDDKLRDLAVMDEFARLAYRVRAAPISLCIISTWLLIGSSFAAASEVAKSNEPTLVSIDAILERKVGSVRSVRWHGSEQLIGQFTEPQSGKIVTRVISSDGALGKPIGKSKLAAASPNGRMLLQYNEDGWIVRAIDSGETALIEEPADESRGFSFCCPPVWSRDGRYVAFICRYRPRDPQNAPDVIVRAGVPVVYVTNLVPTIKRWTSRITIVDLVHFNDSETVAIKRILINDMAQRMQWGRDNTLFVSRTNFFGRETATAVLRIKPGAQEAEEIYRSPGRFQAMIPAVHPDGKLIALVLDLDNRAWSDFQSMLLIDAATGNEVRRLTYDLPITSDNYVWSPQGEEIYARVRNGGLDQIYAIPLDGQPRRLTHGPRLHFDIDLSPDGLRLSYQTKDGYGRKDLRILDLETSEEKVVLVLDEPAKAFKLGEWQHVRWESTDGVKPFGYVIKPPDFEPDRKYPMIVYVHGGGEGSRLYLNAPLTLGVAPGPLPWHAWAALGYVVFVPDYRSTGDYGPQVITARYKSGEIPAIKDIEDIVSGTRFLIGQGSVDPDRVAIFGHSAGGQRAYILLTKCDLYAAAILNEPISPDPVSNFINLASGEYTGSYPAGIYRQYYGGELAEVPDRYKANYMFDSYRNKTPTLIMLGNEALGGVDHMPHEILYSILRQHDVPTKMLKFIEEGHNYSRPESAKLAFEVVRHWLETHMPNRSTDSNSMAPGFRSATICTERNTPEIRASDAG